jgi:SAM-dependent methyltransferase
MTFCLMGLDLNAVHFLLRARKRGVVFGDVLTIGRQKLDVLPGELAQLLQKNGLPAGPFLAMDPLIGEATANYAELFFQCLGAKKVFSLDASNYEGAAFVHDLNQPVPEDWKNRFDVVYDGGTLEHVFHFPTALRSCMEMVRPGGHFFAHAPGNNWLGHGFYQFSPELFYRALSEANGYAVVEMIAHAPGPHARWYRVADPQAIRSRVELISFNLILLLVCAQRQRAADIFRQPPLQSDYTVIWNEAAGGKNPAEKPPGRVSKLAARYFPGAFHLFKALGTGWKFYRTHSLKNRHFFTPVSKE